MVTIWKYPVPIGKPIRLSMPDGAAVLDVQVQGGTPCVWVLIEPDRPESTREFIWYGTGHPMSERNSRYIGTVQMHGGALVFHLFERITTPPRAPEGE